MLFIYFHFAGSSNGRTVAFGAIYLGSNPSPAAVLKGEKPDMGKVTGLTFESEKIIATAKEELKQFLIACDKSFREAVSKVKNWEEKVSVFGTEVPKFGVVELLIRHETLHHGQFIAFGYLLGVQFPQSWIDAWALPIK